MLNLLLREDRHWIRKEYFLRLSIIVVSIAIILGIIWAIVLVSPYSQIFVEKMIIEEQVEDIKNSDVTKERNELKKLSREIDSKMEYLSRTAIDPTFIIAAVLKSQPTGIGLSEIGVQVSDVEDQATAHIEMRGAADSRNDLVIFQKNLLAKDIFSRVDVPFSNFAKDVEVPFTISISSVELKEYLENEENTDEVLEVEEEIEEPVEEDVVEDNINENGEE